MHIKSHETHPEIAALNHVNSSLCGGHDKTY